MKATAIRKKMDELIKKHGKDVDCVKLVDFGETHVIEDINLKTTPLALISTNRKYEVDVPKVERHLVKMPDKLDKCQSVAVILFSEYRDP